MLELIGCSESQVLNIISSNAIYLSKTKVEIIKIINYLSELGFGIFNILYDSNPYILNLEVFEVEKYIK